jgi:pseudoazurin
MRNVMMLGAFVAGLGIVGAAQAAEVEVRMLDKGADGTMAFEPAVVRIAPGDTVRFVAADKGHNVEAIYGMLPDGARKFVGRMSADLSVTFDRPGVYGYRCTPDYRMGMVGMVVVGTPTNLAQAKAAPHPGKAKQAFANLFERLAPTRTAAR